MGKISTPYHGGVFQEGAFEGATPATPQNLRAAANRLEAQAKAQRKVDRRRAQNRKIACETYRQIAQTGRDDGSRLTAAAALLELR